MITDRSGDTRLTIVRDGDTKTIWDLLEEGNEPAPDWYAAFKQQHYKQPSAPPKP